MLAALTTVLIAVGIGLLAYFNERRPPECARLLPESDAIVYLDLAPLRAATHFDRRQVEHEAEYRRFIDATGINFERDLDAVAFALSRQSNPFGPNGPVAYSEVFSGRFDAARLTGWLRQNAAATETYAGRTVYSIPSEGRTVRVAILGRRLCAVSNTPSAEQMHAILDHTRSSGLLGLGYFGGFAGPTLLTEHYRDLPALSLAWGIGQVGLPFADPAHPDAPLKFLGLSLPFRPDMTFLASVRWAGAARLRLEEIAPDATVAAATAGSVQKLLEVARTVKANLPARLTEGSALALVDGMTVRHEGDRVVLEDTLPDATIENLLSGQ